MRRQSIAYVPVYVNTARERIEESNLALFYRVEKLSGKTGFRFQKELGEAGFVVKRL